MRNIQNPILRNLAEWATAILFAFLLFLFIRNFVFRVADVSGHSMEPTLSHGDFVILTRVNYWFNDPQVGDIIAFPYRENDTEFYIKRISAAYGDVVDFQNSRFLINGQETEYEFSDVDVRSNGDIIFPLTVGEGEFFVLGDNRNFSKDSRYQSVGMIRESDMLGRVFIRVWPFNRFGTVEP